MTHEPIKDQVGFRKLLMPPFFEIESLLSLELPACISRYYNLSFYGASKVSVVSKTVADLGLLQHPRRISL